MSEERNFLLEDDEPEEEAPRPKARGDDLLGRKDSSCRRALDKVWDEVKRGFEDQYDRANNIDDFWEAYYAYLNANQYYDGRAKIFVPIIHDAVNAIVTRISNQLFPEGGHYVDVVTDEAASPTAIVALEDHYLRQEQAKTNVCKPLLRCGLIEGHFNVYKEWLEIDREVVSRETHGVQVQLAGQEHELPGDDIDDIRTEDIREARPIWEILHDSDVLVLPSTANSVEQALNAGGLVAIVRRWSKAKVERLKDAGIIVNPGADHLLELMEAQYHGHPHAPRDLDKRLNELVGVRSKGSLTHVWEVWKMLPLNERRDRDGLAYGDYRYKKDGKRRLCQMFFGADHLILGCRRNPHWNDRCPLLSVPVEKVPGQFKGKSQVEYVTSLQYEANDAANEGADMAAMSACGLILRDPTTAGKQPLIMNLGAVWDVPPDSVRFAEFPDLTQRAITRIQQCMQQAFQTLGVNPSMIPMLASGSSRRNQAQVAQEQQIDLLTTTESGSVLTEGILTPGLAWDVDLDYQYREKDVSVETYGVLGIKASMQAVRPQLNRTSYVFKWVGVERARNAQQFQQKIGFLNVVRGLEPVLAQSGYRLNLSMPVEQAAIDMWGPHDGPKIIEDIRASMSMDPELENQLMDMGHEVPIHVLDKHQEHVQSHVKSRQTEGDDGDRKKVHIQRHILHMVQQQAAAMQQANQPPPPGAPPGPQPPNRGGGPPRVGAMPGQPQLVKGPAGAVHPDQMPRAGAVPFPRRY